MAKIYLAAAWSRRTEIYNIAYCLKHLGHEITSRWLVDETDTAIQAQYSDKEREQQHQIHALHDIEDVINADYIIRFSDAEEMSFPLVASKLCSGARHFEMGVMFTLELLAQTMDRFPVEGMNPQHKLLFVVGGKQNIFDRLPGVMHIDSTLQMLSIMKRAAELEGLKAFGEVTLEEM